MADMAPSVQVVVDEAVAAKVRLATIQQCYSVLLGEVGRLRKLQQREFDGHRNAQITVLLRLVRRIQRLK